jgi:exonuclease SbcC
MSVDNQLQQNNKVLQNFEKQNDVVRNSLISSLDQGFFGKKTPEKFIHQMDQLYRTYFDSIQEIPKDTLNLLNELKTEEDVLNTPLSIDDHDIYQSFSILADLENNISQLESLAGSDTNKVPEKEKLEADSLFKKLTKDFDEYQRKVHSNINDLKEDKSKLESVKKSLDKKEEKTEEDNKLDKEVHTLESEMDKMLKELAELEKKVGSNNQKIEKVKKVFK